ncbi:hypothetical protein KUTeg_005659 [Tegillarca granosa]|uniref:Sulfotransferase domain-containing protein n=1 Tax=Tegillarca granosa TaxID=220873 RepID=A0ABQ9FNC2_TEGGR|nr:hypothetical protein KUTeg_005659 [Tegillarca granosa]
MIGCDQNMSHGFILGSLCRLNARWMLRFGTKANFLFIFTLVLFVSIFVLIYPRKQFYIGTTHHTKDYQKSISKIHFLSGNGNFAFEINANNLSTTSSKRHDNIIWNHPTLKILKTEPLQFLPEFKNPCWYESLYDANVYLNNKYSLLSRSVRLNMIDLIQEWSKRIARDKEPKRLRCLPYFFIVGQPKCGSTDLFNRIIQHPDVISPAIKETHWWSRNRQGRSLNYTDIIPMSDYIDTFDKAALSIERHTEPSDISDIKYHNYITGEASVSMMWDNDDWQHFPENQNSTYEPKYVIPDYVHHVIPKAKIIIILRNPTDRLFSDYLYFSKTNKSANEFHQRVSLAIDTYNNCSLNTTVRSCVYNRTVTLLARLRLRVGMYFVYLKDWMRVFPKDQLLILRLEDYSKDLPNVLKKVYNFLNLRPLTSKEEKEIFHAPVYNKRKHKDKLIGKMKNETRTLLNQFYEPYNKQLSQLLKDDKFFFYEKD